VSTPLTVNVVTKSPPGVPFPDISGREKLPSVSPSNRFPWRSVIPLAAPFNVTV